MVQKILGFLYGETATLNQAALLLGLFAFLSHVLAFLRDRLLAHIFGASAELDIYYAAFRVPDFIFVVAASVVSLSVLIPFIVEKDSRGTEAVRAFISSIFSFFAILVATASLLAFLFMPAISSFLFGGLTETALEKIVFVSRLMLLSPIILGFSSLLGSINQAYNRFATYALAPILYNAGIVVGILIFGERLGITGVALGVILGALLHVFIQIPPVVKNGLFPRLVSVDFAAIREVTKISLPRTLTLSLSSIGLIFLVSMASLMPEGSVSVLLLSFNIQAVLISIIGVSYSLAAFPDLSRRFMEQNFGAFINQMAATARFIIFWALPLTALFVIVRAQIVRVILGSGLFDWNDTRLTAALLALFTLSSMFQCLGLLFIRGFYSAGFTRIPLVINAISTAVMLGGTWFLVKLFYLSETFSSFITKLFRVEDIPGTEVLMLPLGFSLATILNGVLHWIVFEKKFRGFSAGVSAAFFKNLFAALVVGVAAYFGLNILAPIFDTTTLFGIFFQGLFAGLFALAAGIAVLFAMGSEELVEVGRVIKGKFWRKKVIAADSEMV
ncbi:MAG: lipid II flippase MurJ [Minisyncoccia bacterium]